MIIKTVEQFFLLFALLDDVVVVVLRKVWAGNFGVVGQLWQLKSDTPVPKFPKFPKLAGAALPPDLCPPMIIDHHLYRPQLIIIIIIITKLAGTELPPRPHNMTISTIDDTFYEEMPFVY